MAPLKPYKSRVLGGSMKTADAPAGVRGMPTRSADMDPNRFATGIMSKYGFTRGNYLGRLSLVFKLQRELVQQVMRGAKSGDVMTNQWFIRIQQLQQAMPATPQVHKVIAETTRLLERVTVVQEAAPTNKGQVPDLSDNIIDKKQNDRNYEDRPGDTKSGRSDRSRKKKADQTARSGEDASGTSERSRNSRKAAHGEKTDHEAIPDQPKRKRGSKRQKTSDTTADVQEIETALSDKKVKSAGKAVAVLRMKPYTNELALLQDRGGSGRNRNLLSELHTQPAMKPIADRFTAGGTAPFIPKQTRFGSQADRLSGSLFLQPFEMILRSIRKRTYIDSIIDKHAGTFNPISRNPAARHGPAGLHRTKQLERYAEQAARVNIEHNEGYSAEIVRPSGRSIGNPAKESKAPSGRTADSIRLSYKLTAPALAETAAEEPARNNKSKHTALGKPAAIADDRSRQNQSLIVRRRLPSPLGHPSIRSVDGYLWPQPGADLGSSKLLQSMMPMVTRRRTADHPDRFAERATALQYALRHISAIHRSPFSKNGAGKSDHRSDSSRWNDRLTGQEELTGRLQPRGHYGTTVQAAESVRTPDSMYATAAARRGAEARPDSFELPQRSNPVSRIIMQRTVPLHRGTEEALTVQSPFTKGAFMNTTASDALRIMRKQFDTAYRTSSLPFILYPDRPTQRANYASVGELLEYTARKPESGIGTVVQRADRTVPNLSGHLQPGIGVRGKQLSIKEEYNKPLRTVHRSLFTRESRVPSTSMRGSAYSNRTPVAAQQSMPTVIGNPTSARPDFLLTSSIASPYRTPASEPIKKAVDPIALSIDREMSALLEQLSVRHESGIQRLMLDPTLKAESDAKRMFPLTGGWETNPANGDLFKSGGQWHKIDRRRVDRFKDAPPELGESAVNRATSRLMPDYEDHQRSTVSAQSGNQASKTRPSAIRTMQQAVIAGARTENGEAALLPSAFRLARFKSTTSSELLHKRSARYLPPERGVERFTGSQPVNPTYIPGMKPIPAPARLFRRTTTDIPAAEPVPYALRLARQRETNIREAIRKKAGSRSSAVPVSGIIKPLTASSQAQPFTYGYKAARPETAKIFRRIDVRGEQDGHVTKPIPLHNLSGKLPVEQRLDEISRIQDDFRKVRGVMRGESDGAAVKPDARRKTSADPVRLMPMVDSSSPASLSSTIGTGRPAGQTGNIPLNRIDRFGYPLVLTGLNKVSEYTGLRTESAIRRSIASATEPIFGSVNNKVHRRRNEGAVNGIGAGTGFETVRGGPSGGLPHSGAVEIGTIRASGTGRTDPRSDMIRRRLVRTESIGSIRWDEESSGQSGHMLVSDIRIRNGLPVLERETGPQRRIGARSAVPYGSGRPGQPSLSHLRRSSSMIGPDESAPDYSGLPTGGIRRKANDLNSALRLSRMPVLMPVLQSNTQQGQYPTNESRFNKEDRRRQTPVNRFRPVTLSNRLSRIADVMDSMASERQNPLQRSIRQRDNSSILHRSGDSPYTDISALPHRYPGRERYGMGSTVLEGASSNLTIYRSMSPIAYVTEKMGAGHPFDSGYIRDRTARDKHGTERDRNYTVHRKEAPGPASVLSTRIGSAAPEKAAFPYKLSGTDRKERDNQRLSGTSSSFSRLEALHYRNRIAYQTNNMRTIVSPVVLQTLDRAVGENGGNFTVLQWAANPLRGSTDSIMHTIRDRIGTMQYATTDKSRAGDKASTAGYRPDRTRTAAATELRIVRMAMASGMQVPGTTGSSKAGGTGQKVQERRVIAPQAAMAHSAAPAQVLQLKVNEGRPNAGMLSMEHKQRASVPGILGSDPADIDYRRQAKPAAPAETVSVIEPAPPQIDMAELQEMVMGLPQFDIKNITDRVYREIERKIRFDRQTRGL